jgi:quercetin dioxygenase-like cupin family protein
VSPFEPYPLKHGPIAHAGDGPHPTTLTGWGRGPLHLPDAGTHFGFVLEGTPRLAAPFGSYRLQPGMYFAAPWPTAVERGRGLVVTAPGHRGFFHLGGPVEPTGRLRYIDGCTDSLLIPPIRRGDPCLNLLHVPPHTRQTAHTHPSARVGLVIRGTGYCDTPDGGVPLAAGLAFVIRAGGLHAFRTGADGLLVLAYHPDSDSGPTDDRHPMLDRTVIPTDQTLTRTAHEP